MNIRIMIGIAFILVYIYSAWQIVYQTQDWTKYWNGKYITRLIVSVVYFWGGLIIIYTELFN